MYGIVNKAMKEMVEEEYGVEVWENIKDESGVQMEDFLSNEAYDDSVTFDLAIAASKVLKADLSTVLEAFGEYWILQTGMHNYGSLMEAGGDDLQEFLENLPNFHSRVMLMFPNLQPPEFRISDIEEGSLHVHYYSHRTGLQDFVRGLMKGLGKMFNKEVSVELIRSRENGHDHEVFHVNWPK